MSKVAQCRHCGQIIPPKIGLPRVKQRIYDCVASHPAGVTTDQILDYVYADDPNGGPDRPCVRAHVYQMNKHHLIPFGVFLRADHGPGAKYILMERANA
jgi:hypothetical protein